jgi:hypothetical protein
MKNETKLGIMMAGVIVFAILHQIKFGNNGSLIVAGIMLFSVGFGWYGGLLQKLKEREK